MLTVPLLGALWLPLVASCGTTEPQPAAAERVATSGQALSSHTWLSGSPYKTYEDWFSTSYNKRVFTGDVTGDGIADLVGFAEDGEIQVSRGTGAAFAEAETWREATCVFAATCDWFDSTYGDRVFVADVTGDGKQDIVGIANNGDIWLSESTGTEFSAARYAGTSSFETPTYFDRSEQQRVFVADVDGDGKSDILGFAEGGDVQVLFAVESESVVSFASETTFLSDAEIRPGGDWFSTATHPRVWVGDVTNDGRADIVGIKTDGDLYVYASTVTGFDDTPYVTPTVFTTARGWFSTSSRPRIWFADVNGDGKQDLVGIAPNGDGDGDVWANLATGSGTTAGFKERVLLNESIFRTGLDWFLNDYQPRVWVGDVTGDGRADITGIAINGDVWVAVSTSDEASPGAPSGSDHTRDYFQPAILTDSSSFTSESGFFDASAHERMWLADVTGDGVKDLVGISEAWGSDGDVLWHMPVPARVTSMTPITKGMINSGTPQAITVHFSRSVAAGSVSAGSLVVKENGTDVTPTAVDVGTKSVTWTVPFATQGTNDTKLEISIPDVTDAWDQEIDGDGDLLEGGVFARARFWNRGLVAGVQKVDLTPETWMTDLPVNSGYVLCETPPPSEWNPGVYVPTCSANTDCASGQACVEGQCRGTFTSHSCSTNADCSSAEGTCVSGYCYAAKNPTMARIVVLAGGGSCDADGDCRSGQTCVEHQCQSAGGEDANRPLVIVNADLVGVNDGRLAELLERRFGIPGENVIFAGTHNHAAIRNIKLFEAPYYDDRMRPYESWIEDSIADGVGAALADMVPVDLSVSTGSATLGYNRAVGSTVPTDVNVIKLTKKSNGAVRATLVDYALHAVFLHSTPEGLSADFPGYMARSLEQGSDPAEVALFVNAGAGDIEPNDAKGDPFITAQNGVALATAARNAPKVQPVDTTGMQISVARRIQTFTQGTSGCNPGCGSDHIKIAGTWEVPATAVSIGRPLLPVLRFGTLPGEPFSALQVRLRDGVTTGPKPILFGYTNGYVGYLVDDYASANGSGYSMTECDGPVFFHHELAHVPGTLLVDSLLGALCADGSCTRSLAAIESITDNASSHGWCNSNSNPASTCVTPLSTDNGTSLSWIACNTNYLYNTPTDFTFDVDGFSSAEMLLKTGSSGGDAGAVVSCVDASGTELAVIQPYMLFPTAMTNYQWSVPRTCIRGDGKVTLRVARSGNNCLGPDLVGLVVE